MSTDWTSGSLLKIGLLWQSRKCAESTAYQLFLYSLFGHACLQLNSVFFSRLTGKSTTQNLRQLRNSSLWTCWRLIVSL